jgi:hypothetical protein
MINRVLALTAVCALGISIASVAQTSGSGEGQWVSALPTPETMETGDGATIQKYVYQQAGLGSGSGPFDNVGADCAGMLIVSSDGAVTAGNGHCRTMSDDGSSGASYWWRVEEAGTDNCPLLCGSFGYFDGYGEYKGISGGGTWRQTVAAPNGVSIGTWEGSYTVE